MIAPWLNPPDFLSAIRAGAGLGLQARAQDASEQQHADQLGLSREEMQARREQHAAALAESLRQHNAMEMYRQQTLEQQRLHQGATEEQAKQSLLQQILNRGQQQENFESQQRLRERAEKRLEDQAAEATKIATGPVTGENVIDPKGSVIPGFHAVRSKTGVHILRNNQTDKPISAATLLTSQRGLPKLISEVQSIDRSAPLEWRQAATNALNAVIQAGKPKAVAASNERVNVKSREGKVGTIPKSQLDQALKAGYSLIDDAAD